MRKYPGYEEGGEEAGERLIAGFNFPHTTPNGAALFWQITSREGGRERMEKKREEIGQVKVEPLLLACVGKGKEGGASPLLLLFSFILSPFFFLALSVFPPLPLLPPPIHLPTSHSRISPPKKKRVGDEGY